MVIMAKDPIIDLGVADFKKYGLRALEDTTAAPFGALKTMRNAQVTDRGGLAPRSGTVQLGNTFYSLWKYRFKITALASQVPHANDVLKYDLSLAPSEFWDFVRTDGGDIRVITSDGETRVALEVVSIDTVLKTGTVFFRATGLAANTDTDFYLYYGNESAMQPEADDVYGSETLWTSLSDVYHFLGNAKDSAVAGNDGTFLDVTPTADGAMFIGEYILDSWLTGATSQPVGKSTTFQKVAQSFIMGPASQARIDLLLARLATTGSPSSTITLSVQADSAGQPSGSNLFSTGISSANWGSITAGRDQIFSTNLSTSLVSGTKYWFVITVASLSDTNFYNVAYDPTGNHGVLKSFDGTNWNVISGTLRFAVYKSGYINLASQVSLPIQDMFVSMIIKKVDANYECLIGNTTASSSGHLEINGASNGSGDPTPTVGRLTYRPSGGNQNSVNGTGLNTADGEEHLLRIFRDATSLRLYVDGVLAGTSSTDTSGSNLFQHIGEIQTRLNSTYSKAFGGLMKELRFGLASLADEAGALTEYNNLIETENFWLTSGAQMTGDSWFSATYKKGPVKGLFNFKKSNGSDELLLAAHGTDLEFVSKNYADEGWSLLRSDFTDEQEFGFSSSLVNTDITDYLVGCNRYEPYFAWTGATAKTVGVLNGSETTIIVDTTILPDIYESKTASTSSPTTLDIPITPWVASQWVNFYVRISSGIYSGLVRKITANTTNELTFDALPGDPGAVPFEIRKLAFPATGTLVYGGNDVDYSAVDTDHSFTVVSAFPANEGTVVSVRPIEYTGAPRGNRLCNYLARIIIGHVRSALTRDDGGALQGYAAAGSTFVSKLKVPTDFTFAAARAAGEGDVISMPYGGGDITDVLTREDGFYSFKSNYIEHVTYSQDENDLAVRDPLKSGFGSVGKVTPGSSDAYFFTADKQLTSLGRVKTKDIRPDLLNIGNSISRFLEATGIDSDVGRGMEIANKLYVPIKLYPSSNHNDAILIYNLESRIFEGVWDIPANFIERWNSGAGDKYYYGDSNLPIVAQLFYQHADVIGDNRFPIDFEVATHAINLTASKGNVQATSGIQLEGYIAGGAKFTTKIFGDFANDPFLQFDFSFNESGFLDGSDSIAFLGGKPMSLDPLSTVYSDPGADGRRHFMFTVRYPFQYNNYFDFGFSSSTTDADFEIVRVGLFVKESPSIYANRIKYV